MRLTRSYITIIITKEPALLGEGFAIVVDAAPETIHSSASQDIAPKGGGESHVYTGFDYSFCDS